MSAPTGTLLGMRGAADPVLTERAARHAFGQQASDVPGAVLATTAIQAQDPAAARLGVRARAGTATDAQVLAAVTSGALARTWLMRGTIHLVRTADLHWLVRLLGPGVLARHAGRWRQLGWTEPLFGAALAALPELLADGPRSRAQLQAALVDGGLRLPSADPALGTHLLIRASCEGLVCRAADRGRQATFALIDSWHPGAPPGPSGDDALAELARRYFAAYAPATAADFTCWSGLPSRRAIELIRGELTEVPVYGRRGFRPAATPTPEPVQGVHLLPAFDNYVLGYQERSTIVPAARHREVYHGGMIYPTVLMDGAVVGTWRLDRHRGVVCVAPFDDRPGRRFRDGVAAEVADLGRFLDRDLVLREATAADRAG